MSTDPDTLAFGGKVMSFREHLMELRRRLVRATFIVVIGAFITWEYRIPLFEFLARPVADALADNGVYSFQTITLTEGIVVYMKVTFVAALVFLSPYLFWELWAFISPGLYKREKRFILPLTAFSVAFFLLGAAFAYVVLLPFMTDWLVNLTLEAGHIDVTLTLANTYSFAFSFLLMFGLVFELPLVLFFLALWGAVTGKGLLKFWRYFVVISFVVSGVLTPPDPLSQTFMAVPLNVLYGFGVLVAFTVSRARASGRADASRLALRAMGLSMAALLVLASAFFLLIAGLPDKPLTAWMPPNATFAAGMNPRILAQEKAVLGLVSSLPESAKLFDALRGAGVELDALTEGMVIGTADGRRAVVLRASGLAKKLEAAGALATLDAARIDDDTLVLGPKDLATTIAGLDPVAPTLGPEGQRLMTRLAGSGPLWVWLPTTSPARAAVLGVENATELESVGAALSLGQRRQVVFDLPLSRSDVDNDSAEAKAERETRGDRLLARIEAARVAALSTDRDAEARVTRLSTALVALADEVAPLLEPGAKQRVEALRAVLQAPNTRTMPETFPALSTIAAHLRGVSVRREDTRLTVTAELDDQGLSALFSLLVAR